MNLSAISYLGALILSCCRVGFQLKFNNAIYPSKLHNVDLIVKECYA